MFKLKKRITKNLLAITMICVFIISWMLHGYQWFWIRGFYTFNSLDLIFWLVLGGCITVNAVIQEKQSQKPFKEVPIYKTYFINSLKMVGMFLFMSVAWSFWSSSNLKDWLYLMSMFNRYSTSDLVLLSVILLSVIAVTFSLHIILNKPFWQKIILLPPQNTLFLTLPSLVCIAWFSLASARLSMPDKINGFVSTLSDEKLNATDKEKAEENYYKKMLDGEENQSTGLWETSLKRPRHEDEMDKVYIRTDDLLTKVFKPNSKILFK